MSLGAEIVLVSLLCPDTKGIGVCNQHLLSGCSSEGSSVVEGLQTLCQGRARSGQQRKSGGKQVSLAFERILCKEVALLTPQSLQLCGKKEDKTRQTPSDPKGHTSAVVQ